MLFSSERNVLNYVITLQPQQLSQYSDQTTGRKAQGSNAGRKRDFFHLQKVQTGSGAHTAPYSMVTREWGGGCVKMTTDLNLVPRLR